jgi:dihydroceramidase
LSREIAKLKSMAGLFTKVTSDYDWCEANYAVTFYIAEFWNTLSSIFIVLAGVFFFRRTTKHQYGLRFHLASLGVIVIGVGSVAFHGTLQKWGQVLDEVPMLWSSLIFLWIGLCNAMDNATEARYSTTAALCLSAMGGLSTLIYFRDGFTFFIITYIITVASIFGVTLYQLRAAVNESPARSYAIWSIALYAGGFFCLWIPEQLLCGNRLVDTHDSGLLRLPIPLHAFFHITSSIGPVCCLIYMTFEHLEARGKGPVLVRERPSEFCCLIDVGVVKCEKTV